MNKQQLIEKAVLQLNGEFPQGDEGDDCLYQFSNGRYVTGAPGGVNPHAICTREEFNSAADRMRGKPDWSLAPYWAESLAQDENGYWWFYDSDPALGGDAFITPTSGRSQKGGIGRCFGDWRNTLEKRPEHIGGTNEKVDPAPAKPWFEAGELPPIGQKCERSIGLNKWCETIIFAHSPDMAYAAFYDGNGMGWADNCKFRPIKTDKEKAIEAADLAIHQYSAGAGIRTELLGALYDAGLLRLPDNKKPD